MSGKIVKTRSGKIGRIKNDDDPVYTQVMDNSNPFMARVREIAKVKVYLDDGTQILTQPINLEFIGFWD